jgi:methylmalonyl-CoA mutase N-terminal domain/subunit
LIVGVNSYIMDEKVPMSILKVTREIEKKQLGKLEELKSGRDSAKVAQALENLKKTAQGDENTMPAILEAVKVYCTLGEICDVLRDVFGEYKAPNIF